MIEQPELSIVIPLYNEHESVEPLLSAIAAAQAEADATVAYRDKPDRSVELPTVWEVILVDDGSTDATYRTAVSIADQYEHDLKITVVSLQRNFGQTAAMQAGIERASGQWIATLDGDLQNDPADIPKMVAHLIENDLDLLVGRRRNRQDGLWLRLIPSYLANRLIRKVTGVHIHDYGCSLKVYRGRVIRSVKLMGEMHRFIPAWVATVSSPSRIGEIDVAHRARKYGQSKYGISRTFRVVLDLLSVLFFMKYRMRPGHFFGAIGLFAGGVGGLMLTEVFVSKFVFGEDIGNRPMLLLGAVTMIASIQMICFGVMAEMLSRIHYQASDQTTYTIRQCYGNTAVDEFRESETDGRALVSTPSRRAA